MTSQWVLIWRQLWSSKRILSLLKFLSEFWHRLKNLEGGRLGHRTNAEAWLSKYRSRLRKTRKTLACTDWVAFHYIWGRCVDAHGRLHNTEVWWHFELVHQYPLCQLATLYLQHREHTFIRNSLWYDCCWKVDWCTEINVWSKSNTTASAPSLGEYRTHSASNLYGNRTQVL